MFHLPNEIDTGALARLLAEQHGGEAPLRQLLRPYLLGELTPTAPPRAEERALDDESPPTRSFQTAALSQPMTPWGGRARDAEAQQTEALFPLLPEEADEQLSILNELGQFPAKVTRGGGGVSEINEGGRGAIVGGGYGADPSYNMLSNAIRILQGRIRQNPDMFDFNPTRTESPGAAGMRATGLANRMNMYLNTPVSTPVTTIDPPARPIGVLEGIQEQGQ